QTPVQVNLPRPLKDGSLFTLKNTKTSKAAVGQLLDSVTLVFILPDSMVPGSWQTYTVTKLTSAAPRNVVTVAHEKNGLQVNVKTKPLFFYHTAEAMPPADSPAYYRRSGFIHPVY